MSTLDCENEIKVLESIGEILDLSRRSLSRLLLSPDFPEGTDGQEFLLQLVKTECSSSYCQRYTACCWFHGTRVPPGCRFDEGILPLPVRIESLWGFLHSLVSPTVSASEWRHFRTSVETDHEGYFAKLYRTKIANSRHHGPHAFLVRDAFFSPQDRNHDYLAIPEIVEDICTCYNESFISHRCGTCSLEPRKDA